MSRPETDRPFRAPWEAQLFAIVTALIDAGVVTTGEWAACLGRAIRAAQAAGDPGDGASAYRHWAAALEELLATKGLASPVLIEAREAGLSAAEHGQASSGRARAQP